ncbi:hypothetical protein AAHE18_15G127100 [Arachis hypogaea]
MTAFLQIQKSKNKKLKKTPQHKTTWKTFNLFHNTHLVPWTCTELSIWVLCCPRFFIPAFNPQKHDSSWIFSWFALKRWNHYCHSTETTHHCHGLHLLPPSSPQTSNFNTCPDIWPSDC